MGRKKSENSLKEFEKALRERTGRKFVLKLYITGATQKSLRAVENVRRFCDEYLKDDYELEVIDIYQQPRLIQREQIIAAPTLVKKLPPPYKKFIGDMSDLERIVVGFNLKSKRENSPSKKEDSSKVTAGKHENKKRKTSRKKSGPGNR